MKRPVRQVPAAQARSAATRRAASPPGGSRRTWFVGALTLAVLAACSTTPPTTGGPATATIGPAGGAIDATGPDEVRYRIAFPAGAFDRPTEVTLRPLAAASGSVARFRVEPAGLVLGAAATITATLPPGIVLADDTTFAFGPEADPTYVPTTLQGPSLQASARFFGIPTDAWGTQLAPAANGNGALATDAASAGTAVPRHAASTMRMEPQQTGDDTVAAAQASCAQRLASLQSSYDALMATNAFEAAVRVSLAAGSLAMQCADDEQVTTWFEQVPAPACARYEDLVLLAQVVAADTYERFTELAQPVMNWWSTLQELDVTCPSATTPTQVIGEKLSQFLTFYSGEVAGMAFTSDYDALLAEARKVWGLRGQASQLDLSDVETQLEQQVLFPIMDLLRDRSFDECVDASDHYYLYTMLHEPFTSKRVPIGSIAPLATNLAPQSGHAGFEDTDIQTDIQYCASELTLEVWADPDVPEELADKRRELGPGSEPGQQTSTASTEGPVEGHLVLRGPIDPMLCGDERSIVDHELVVKFHGTEVHRASSLDADPEIDIEGALASAGLSPEGINDVDVTVTRESDACQARYGATEYVLFTVTYTADPAPNATAAAVTPTSMAAENDTNFTFQLPWNDAGENLTTLHMRYDLAGAVQTQTVDLASSGDVAGFTGSGGTGTYQQPLWVGCSEKGKNPIVITMTLEDAYGQRSEERQTQVTVDYGACPNAVTSQRAADVAGGAVMFGGTVGGTR